MPRWKMYLPALLLLVFGAAQGKSGMAIELTLYASFYLAGLYKKEYTLYLFALAFPFMTYRPLMFFLLVMVLLLLVEGVSKERLVAVWKSKVFRASAFFVLATGITAITSVNLRESMGEYLLYYIPSLLLTAVLMLFVESRAVLYRFLLCLAVSCALVSLYGIAQYFQLDVTSLKWVDVKQNPLLSKRIFATFGNPNVFSQYLIMMLPLMFALLYYVRNFWHKVLLAPLFAIGSLALVLTYSRGAWVAFALAGLIMLIRLDRKIILAGLVLVLVAVFFDLIPEVIKMRIASIANPSADTSGSYRLEMWTSAAALIRDYWLTGIGMDQSTFFKVYVDYQMPSVTVFHFHNIWIQAIVTGGVLGIASLCYLFYQMLKTSFTITANRESGRVALWGIALFASVVAIGVAGMTEDVWRNYRVMMAFWVIAGIIGGIEKLLRLERRNDETA